MKKITLIAISIIGILYCFRFGYIWTAYGHGGQLLGLPFALLLIILTYVFFKSESRNKKSKYYKITTFLFMSLSGFSLTVEIILKTYKNAFEILYSEQEGKVDMLLFGWLLIGGITYFGIKLNKINKEKQIK